MLPRKDSSHYHDSLLNNSDMSGLKKASRITQENKAAKERKELFPCNCSKYQPRLITRSMSKSPLYSISPYIAWFAQYRDVLLLCCINTYSYFDPVDYQRAMTSDCLQNPSQNAQHASGSFAPLWSDLQHRSKSLPVSPPNSFLERNKLYR